MTVTVRGTSVVICQERMYGSPATTTVSVPVDVPQIASANGAVRNSSILSYSSDVATAIFLLVRVVRIANENVEATATSPHKRIPDAIITSMRENPRVVLFMCSERQMGRGRKNVRRTPRDNQENLQIGPNEVID